jgi:hypothetical protein
MDPSEGEAPAVGEEDIVERSTSKHAERKRRKLPVLPRAILTRFIMAAPVSGQRSNRSSADPAAGTYRHRAVAWCHRLPRYQRPRAGWRKEAGFEALLRGAKRRAGQSRESHNIPVFIIQRP